MNKQRRDRIAELIERLEVIQGEITDIYNEEDEARHNIPESMQERREKADFACGALENAEQYATDLTDALQEAQA